MINFVYKDKRAFIKVNNVFEIELSETDVKRLLGQLDHINYEQWLRGLRRQFPQGVQNAK